MPDIAPFPAPEQQDADRVIIDVSDPYKGITFICRCVGSTSLVAMHPDGGPVAGYWADEGSLSGAQEWVTRKNEAGYNIYFNVNRPCDGTAKKPAKSDITRIRGVYADVDAKDGRSLEQALADVRKLAAPSFLVMSGGGYQPVWLLDKSLPATPENVAWAEATGKRIADICGGDAVQNVDRILRVPGTINWPNARKRAAGRQPCRATVVMIGSPMPC